MNGTFLGLLYKKKGADTPYSHSTLREYGNKSLPSLRLLPCAVLPLEGDFRPVEVSLRRDFNTVVQHGNFSSGKRDCRSTKRGETVDSDSKNIFILPYPTPPRYPQNLFRYNRVLLSLPSKVKPGVKVRALTPKQALGGKRRILNKRRTEIQ